MIYFQNDTANPTKQYVYFDSEEIFMSVLRYLTSVGVEVENGGSFSSAVSISLKYRNVLLINSEMYGSELDEIRSQFSVFDELQVVETNAITQDGFIKYLSYLDNYL